MKITPDASEVARVCLPHRPIAGKDPRSGPRKPVERGRRVGGRVVAAGAAEAIQRPSWRAARPVSGRDRLGRISSAAALWDAPRRAVARASARALSVRRAAPVRAIPAPRGSLREGALPLSCFRLRRQPPELCNEGGLLRMKPLRVTAIRTEAGQPARQAAQHLRQRGWRGWRRVATFPVITTRVRARACAPNRLRRHPSPPWAPSRFSRAGHRSSSRRSATPLT